MGRQGQDGYRGSLIVRAERRRYSVGLPVLRPMPRPSRRILPRNEENFEFSGPTERWPLLCPG